LHDSAVISILENLETLKKIEGPNTKLIWKQKEKI